MKIGLAIVALAFVVVFFAPERRCEALSCAPPVMDLHVGDLVKLERVDGKPIDDPELAAYPASACFARTRLGVETIRGGDCHHEHSAYSVSWAAP